MYKYAKVLVFTEMDAMSIPEGLCVYVMQKQQAEKIQILLCLPNDDTISKKLRVYTRKDLHSPTESDPIVNRKKINPGNK